MSVHRVRLWYSMAGAASFHGWLDVWLTNMQPWTADEVTNEVPSETISPIDSDLEYYQTELAFDWSEDKAIILDNLDGYLASYCDWHQLAYHVCDHDADSPSGCSWDEMRENGTVPSDIPRIKVT